MSVRKTVLACVVGGVFLLLAGGAVTYYVVVMGQDVQAAQGPQKAETGPVHSVPEIITNLADSGRSSLVQVQIQLEVDQDETLVELEQMSIPVRDRIIAVLRSKTSDEVSGDEGMRQLGREVKQEINDLLSLGRVIRIYFTKLIIQ